MSIHDGFLDLAATAIDFDLDEYEQAELDRHLAGCDACRRDTVALRDDAVAIASEASPRLPPVRSVAILADILRPQRRSLRWRGVALVGASVLVVGLAAAGLVYVANSRDPVIVARSSPSPSAVAASDVPTDRPTHRAGMTARLPSGPPRPMASPTTATLPVRGPADELGREVRMAPGPEGDLFVSLPGSGDTVLVALIDPSGHPRAGWPILLERTSSCGQLLPVADGSVRLLCTPAQDNEIPLGVVRAFAFDSSGGSLPAWPVDLDRLDAGGYFAARVIGDQLTVLAWKSLGDEIPAGQPAGNAWIMTVAPDGTAEAGTPVSYGIDCCIDTWVLGLDAVAYGTVHHFADTQAGAGSELVAIGPTGVPAGFPVAIAGSASRPALDDAGLVHLTVGTPGRPPAGTLVFDSAGRTVDVSSGEMDIAPTSELLGGDRIGDIPVAPLVGRDGTTYVIDLSGGATTVAGVDPAGRLMPGWPYRSSAGVQRIGACPSGTLCQRSSWAPPAIGPGNTMFLTHEATTDDAGGTIVAVGEDGSVVDGWPVGLKRRGSEIWSIVVGSNGTAYSLAVEPEPNGSHSATILTLAADSTVRYTLTIVEP